MDTAAAAQLIAGVATVGLAASLKIVGRSDRVAQQDLTYDLRGGTERTVTKGSIVPEGQFTEASQAEVHTVKRSWLGAIVSGVDHRTSTSKTVAFVWTLVVAFGLLSLVVAAMLGDHDPWNKAKDGLQEEYLLLLGGPYAAAVLAKYATSGQGDAKTTGDVGDASASQLVNNDDGNTDLGDFQYVLFNVIGLLFFLGDFIGHLSKGFPDLPPVLTGLVLTSTGGYAAKKLLAQTTPTLMSVLPAAAKAGDSVQVFGTGLSVPVSVSGTAQPLDPTIVIGQLKATVTAHDLIFGNDRLTVTIDAGAPAGSAPITAMRADGVPVSGPGGIGALAFEVLAGTVVPAEPPANTAA